MRDIWCENTAGLGVLVVEQYVTSHIRSKLMFQSLVLEPWCPLLPIVRCKDQQYCNCKDLATFALVYCVAGGLMGHRVQ